MSRLPKRSTSKTGRYSKVSRRIWNDERFRRLTPILPCGQGLFLRLLTAPELTNIPGLFQAWEAGLAQSLGWTLEAFREAFAEGCREGLVKASWKDGLVWLPKAIWHNEPGSPNVVLSWSTAWAELPDCPLKNEAFLGLKDWAKAKGKPWEEAFGKALPKACLNQMQEQMQDQDQIPPNPPSGGTLQLTPPEPKVRQKRTRAAGQSGSPCPQLSEFKPSEQTIHVARDNNRDWRRDFEAMRDWSANAGAKGIKKDWDAALRNWMRSSFNSPTTGGRRQEPPQPNDENNRYRPREMKL